MVKNLSTLFSKASSSSSSSSSELTEATKTNSGQPATVGYAPDRKVSNASILTTSTVSSNSSDSSYSARMSRAFFVQSKISEDMETPNLSCAHRRSCGSIDLTALLGKANVVGLLDRADQDARIKNQLLRKHASSARLESNAAHNQSSNEPNIKIVMNADEDSGHKASSLNSSQLESKLRANASFLRSDSRQYRSNSCSGANLAISHTTVNNYLSVPEQTVNLVKNRKTSASSILDKSNRYELDMLHAKFCSSCHVDPDCRFYLTDNQSTNSANSNNQSHNGSSSNIYFEFLSSESLPNERDAESPNSVTCNLKSHILSSHTSAGINLTKSAADILLENVNFKDATSATNKNFNKLVKFKSDTNFISNLDYGKESKKKSDPSWHNEAKQIASSKKLNKKSSQLQQKSATSIHMFSGISKPLIKMNSKLKFRSKSSTQLVDETSGASTANLADSLQNPEKNQLEPIESKDEPESDKGECRRKTSVLHGFYSNNYQLYHNLNSHSRNQKRYSSSINDAYSNSSQNSNVKSIATNFAKDIKSKATNLLRRRHTDASFIDKGLVPSRDEIFKWQTSFEHLLRHKYGIALFRGFLKTEFSEENIEFWLECEDYKYTSKEIKRIAKSKKIYQDFVAIGSPKEVNLDIELRAHTAQSILNPNHDTFDRAQKRIQALMEKDSYPRFLESSLYKNLIGSYSPPVGEHKPSPLCVSSENLSSSSSSKSIQLSLTKLFAKVNQNEPQDQRCVASTSSNELLK